MYFYQTGIAGLHHDSEGYGMQQKTRIGIIGATGYVGAELARILYSHDGFELTLLTSQSFAGKPFSQIYPAFRGLVDLPCRTLDLDEAAALCDIVVTALPHGVSSATVPQLLERGLRVLDHSGDFRYREVAAYEDAYKLTHPEPALLAEAVYGLPELYRAKIGSARLIGDPGCYPTCSILALAPALKGGAVSSDRIIVDAVSGVSGAGRKSDLAYSYCETDESFRAYGVIGHRHTSEIEQELSLLAGRTVAIGFTPHLAPMKRGMLATVYADLTPGVTAESLHQMYESYYKDEPFVRVLPAGTCPDTRHVSGTNMADIGVFADLRNGRAVLLCAIDNLGKGSASQAVQSLNLMAGLPETAGLVRPGMML